MKAVRQARLELSGGSTPDQLKPLLSKGLTRRENVVGRSLLLSVFRCAGACKATIFLGLKPKPVFTKILTSRPFLNVCVLFHTRCGGVLCGFTNTL